EALNQGRQATYRARDVQGAVPESFLQRYFEQQGERFVFNKELRRAVIFGRHDLIQDAPISRVNLLVCRNCLMYFNAEAQVRVLERFHFALDDAGFIFLGKAEMLFSRHDMFRPVDLKRRVFSKLHRANNQGHLVMNAGPDLEGFGRRFEANVIRSLAFENDPVAQIAVDASGTLTLANSRARTLFGLASNDVGRLLKDLEISHRPFALQTLLERAESQHHATTEREAEFKSSAGEAAFFDIQIIPLTDSSSQFFGFQIAFRDVTGFR